MFSLTAREQTLLVVVLAATLLGAAAKHWRDVRREQHAAATANTPAKSPAASRGAARVKAAPRPATPPPPQVARAEETGAR